MDVVNVEIANLDDLKKRFVEICATINRPGMEDLMAWLERSDFYTAPASTRFHGNYTGGLLEHSLNVYDKLSGFVARYPELEISPETVAVTALFHDLTKVNYYTVSSRNVKDDVIMVFYKSPPPYHPQMTVGEKNHTKGKAVGKQAEDVHSNRSYGNYTLVESPDGNMKSPASIWRFPKPHPSVALHATEKPVDLLRYAIRTYTDRNAIVLDNCCGTGSTLIAAKLEGRRYIGIDNGVCDKKKSPYYGMPWAQVAQIRLEAIDHEPADEPERHRPLGEGTTEGVCTPSGVSA